MKECLTSAIVGAAVMFNSSRSSNPPKPKEPEERLGNSPLLDSAVPGLMSFFFFCLGALKEVGAGGAVVVSIMEVAREVVGEEFFDGSNVEWRV